jgi:hypothetical protein
VESSRRRRTSAFQGFQRFKVVELIELFFERVQAVQVVVAQSFLLAGCPC